MYLAVQPLFSSLAIPGHDLFDGNARGVLGVACHELDQFVERLDPGILLLPKHCPELPQLHERGIPQRRAASVFDRHPPRELLKPRER